MVPDLGAPGRPRGARVSDHHGVVLTWGPAAPDRGSARDLAGQRTWTLARRSTGRALPLAGGRFGGVVIDARAETGGASLQLRLEPTWLRAARGRAVDDRGEPLAEVRLARGALRVTGAAGWVEVRPPWSSFASPAALSRPCTISLSGGARGVMEASGDGRRRVVRAEAAVPIAEPVMGLLLAATLAADSLYLRPSRGPLGGW